MQDRDAKPTHYFLVEVWVERSVIEGLPPVARARLRDLASDREAYVKSTAELAAFLETSLAQAGVHDVRWHEDED